MKKQLLTTIIVAAAGLTGLVAAEEDSERLAPPAAPYVKYVISRGDACEVRIVFPYLAVANKEQDLETPVVTGTDAKGNEVTFFYTTKIITLGQEAELLIGCPIAGIQGGELDTHGSLSVTTGDDIAFSAPATFDAEQTGSIEIGGTTFDVFFDNEGGHWPYLHLTPGKGEIPCAMRCFWQSKNDTRDVTQDPEELFFVMPANVEINGDTRFRCPVGIPDETRATVQTINVTNPHTVSFPLDFHIVTEPMMQTRFQFPQDSGIRVFKQCCATFLEYGIVKTGETIELLLDGEGEEFLDGCQVTVEGVENANLLCYPTSDPRDPDMVLNNWLSISIGLSHPANAGQVSHSGTLTVKTSKRTLTIPFTTSGNIRTPFRANR